MIVSTKHLMILAMMMVMTISANAMSYNAAKHEALFLSDKMAYELNLTAAQYEAVYEINLDYLMSLNGNGDVFGIWWDRRNADLREGVRELPWWSQQSSWFTLCSHAQARSTSPCSSSAPSCPSSASPKGSCES